MLWTYRVCRDEHNRCSIREVFYDEDQQVINYGKTPVHLLGASAEELSQILQWCQAALELPVIEIAELDQVIARRSPMQTSDSEQNISLAQVMATLDHDPAASSLQ